MAFINHKTAANIDAERIESLSAAAKSKRNRLLLETDYLAMPDYPNPPIGIMEYRQALRDITDQAGFPENIEWPIKPEEV